MPIHSLLQTFLFLPWTLAKMERVWALTFRLENHVGVCVCVCELLVLNSKKGREGILMLTLKSWVGRVAYTHLVPCKEVKASQVYTLNVFTFHQSFLSQFLVAVFCFFGGGGGGDAFCSHFPTQFYINISKFSPFYTAKHSPFHLYRRIL